MPPGGKNPVLGFLTGFDFLANWQDERLTKGTLSV